MVVDLLYAGNVLRNDNGRLPRPFLSDNAAEMDDAIAHHDIDAERTPVLLLEHIEDAAANMIVVSSRIGDFAGNACYRLQ